MFIFHASHILWSQTYCVSLILFRCKNQSTEAIFRPCRSRLPTAMEVAAEAKQETVYLTQKTQWLAVFSKSRNRMTCASHGFWGPLPQQMSQPCHWKLKLRTRLEEHCVWWHQTIFHHEWSELQAWLSSCIADVLHDVWHVLIRYAVLTTVFGLVALKHQPTSASTQCMSLRPAAVDAPAALAEAVHLTQFTLCFEQLDHVCSALCTMHFHLQTFLTVSCSPFMHHKYWLNEGATFCQHMCKPCVSRAPRATEDFEELQLTQTTTPWFAVTVFKKTEKNTSATHGFWGLLPFWMPCQHHWKLCIRLKKMFFDDIRSRFLGNGLTTWYNSMQHFLFWQGTASCATYWFSCCFVYMT